MCKKSNYGIVIKLQYLFFIAFRKLIIGKKQRMTFGWDTQYRGFGTTKRQFPTMIRGNCLFISVHFYGSMIEPSLVMRRKSTLNPGIDILPADKRCVFNFGWSNVKLEALK